MSNWATEWLTLIEDCEQRESHLTEWEVGFLDALRRQLEKDQYPLSDKQSAKLDSIWERVTKKG